MKTETQMKYRIIDYCQNWARKNKEYGVYNTEVEAISEICRLAECVIDDCDLSNEEEKEILNFAQLGHFDHDGHFYKIQEIEA